MGWVPRLEYVRMEILLGNLVTDKSPRCPF